MAKKVKTYTLDEVKRIALNFLKEKYFGGCNPSDRTFNWTWGVINDSDGQNNVFGIWLRFGLQTFCVSFADDLNIFPSLEINGFKVLGYKHWDDLTKEERHELKVCDFLERI